MKDWTERKMRQQKSKKGSRTLTKRGRTGKTVVRREKSKPKQATCARCGAMLQGVPRAVPSKLRKKTRSKRRVSRKFGGVLCGNCVREAEKYVTRMEGGYEVKRDLTIEKFLPAGWHASLKAEKPAPKKEEPKKLEKKEAGPKKPAKKTTKKK